MRRATKMLLTDYRSRNEGDNYRNENYRNEGYRNEDNQMTEMRRRRDGRGRYMESEGFETSGESDAYRNNNMRSDYQSEGRNMNYRSENYSGKIIRPSDHGPGYHEEEEEYPKPYLLPHKDPIGFHGAEERQGKQQSKELDQRTAQEWAQRLKNEDGSKGPHWSIEQVKPLMLQAKFTGNPLEFWVIMNALYSDFCKMAGKYGVDTPEFYAELAKAWLEDKDAVPNKAAMYYDCIVKH